MSKFYSLPFWPIIKISTCFLVFSFLFVACTSPEKEVDPQEEEKKYTLSIKAGDGGVVSSSGGTYNLGTSVTIRATPNGGYVFTSWSNGSTENPLSITINADTELLANFKRLPQGYVDDGIYLDVDYDINFRKFGNGPVKVLLADVFGYWNEDYTQWIFSDDSHGGTMMDTFNHYSTTQNVTLFTFEGNSNDAFYAINTNETVIISASAHDGDPFIIADRQYAAVEKFNTVNALYLSSLENTGVDGSLDDGTYAYPHAGNAYVIENNIDALNKTIFVAFYQDFNGTKEGHVDMHGDFVENNLDNTIFVEMTKHREETGSTVSTSHATPKLAAFATKILHYHPELTARELKNKILELTVATEIIIQDLKSEVTVEGINYDFVEYGFGYTYYNTTVTANLLSDHVLENY